MAEAVGHVFISYVREDAEVVDRLQAVLEAAGIPVWRDLTNLDLGLDWRATIRRAITDEALAFLACFSTTAVTRKRTEQRTELLLAIEEYRRRQPDRPWLIPVRLDDCTVPDLGLGAGRTLPDLNRVDVFGDEWAPGTTRLIANLRRLLPLDAPPPSAPASTAPPPRQIVGGDRPLPRLDLPSPSPTGPRAGTRPEAYRRFWVRYLAELRSRHPHWIGTKTTAPKVGYVRQRCDDLDSTHIAAAFKNNGRLGHELVVEDAEVYDWLLQRRRRLDEPYGRALEWMDLPGRKRHIIGDYSRFGSIEMSAHHDDYIAWFLDCGERLRSAIDDLPT